MGRQSRPFFAALGFSVYSALALMPLACGDAPAYPSFPSSSFSSALEVPPSTARLLEECVIHNASDLARGETFAVIFDVEATRAGNVRDSKIRDSQIRGSAMESCMKQALNAMRVPQEVIAKSTHGPISGHASAEARETAGFVQVLAPIIVEMVPVLIKAAEVTIVVVVSAVVLDEVVVAVKSTDAPIPPQPDCKDVKERCIASCSSSSLPTYDHGFKFWNCVKRCMAAEGC